MITIIFPDTNTKNNRKYIERIERHSSDYNIMAHIYKRESNKNENVIISVREAAILILLYERLNDSGYDIPLYSGYSKQKQKIKQLIKKIDAFLNKKDIDAPLSEEEFFLASTWLFNQMTALMRCQTKELRDFMIETQRKFFKIFLIKVPVITPDTFECSHTELVEYFIPDNVREEIVNEAKTINELNSLDNSIELTNDLAI